MERATAQRIGGHAYRYFATASRTGRVASRFRDGLNILFEDGTAPTLVSIQTPKVPLHPWGMEVVALGERIAIDDVVTVSPEALHLASSHVAWRQAVPHDLRITPYDRAQRRRMLEAIPALEVCRSEALSDRSDPFQSRIDSALAGWRTTGEVCILPALIGLGSGSTPAGDDVLVGLLAGWTALERAEEHAAGDLAVLRPVLSEMTFRRRTSAAAAQMLGAALDGAFPEPLRDLVALLGVETATDAEIRDVAASLTGLGATSGRMMLHGLLAAFGSSSSQTA